MMIKNKKARSEWPFQNVQIAKNSTYDCITEKSICQEVFKESKSKNMTTRQLIRELQIILWFGGDEKAYNKRASRKWKFTQIIGKNGNLYWNFE